MPVNHVVWEPNIPAQLLQSHIVEVGDTIEYITNNQIGYKKYRVVRNHEGNKSMVVISTYYDMSMTDTETDSESEEE